MKFNNIVRSASEMCSNENIVSFDLGTISYSYAASLQQDLFNMVKETGCMGFLLLLEHNPVITIGSNRSTANLLTSPDSLSKKGIELVQSARGGDITFHGPGQLVGYPIINLSRINKDLQLYVFNLEQVIINALSLYGLKAERIKGHRGVFVNNLKIASLGIKVKKWITMHGFAVNVSTNLEYFSHIIACGLAQYPPSSMLELLNRKISINLFKEHILREFEKIFPYRR